MSCWYATHDDMELLLVLAREFHALSPFKNFKFSPSGTRNYLNLILRDPNSTIIMHENGAIGASVTDYPFCEMRVSKEAFWYSRKEGLGGFVLLKEYIKWVSRKKAQVDMLSSLEINDREQKILVRALRIAGYQTVERTHMRMV